MKGRNIRLALRALAMVSILALAATEAAADEKISNLIVNKRSKITTVKEETKPKAKAKVDTIYCTAAKKQHGWFAPMDTVPAEWAQHRTVMRFTCPTADGMHWRRMESVGPYGYVTGNFSPYIAPSYYSNDTLANKEWQERLKKACIHETLPDAKGQAVQERAYDADHNIIYTYSRNFVDTLPNGRRRYCGTYRDFYGLPAEMRVKSTGTYGTCVMITEDQWGNDSVIQYVDAKGQAMLNSNGVAMDVHTYDKYGHAISNSSRDEEGNLVKDEWGNCGLECTYNKDHTVRSVVYMDEYWKPMRMPSSFRSAYDQTRDSVICTIYKYNQYLAEISQSYFLADATTPDCNKYGAHLIEFHLDTKSNLIGRSGYDLNGNLAACEAQGEAKYEAEYDEHGNITDVRWFDKDNKPLNAESSLCRLHMEYGEDGSEIIRDEYSYVDDAIRLTYSYRKTDTIEERHWPVSGEYRKTYYDNRGRETSYSNFVIENGEYSLSHYVVEYEDGDGVCLKTVTYCDENGTLTEVDGIAKECSVYDSTQWSVKWAKYDLDGNLVSTWETLHTEGFKEILGEYDLNSFFARCRAGGTEGARHYKGDVWKNQKGGIASIIARDEFGEADYIDTFSPLYYYNKIDPNGNQIFYDENDSIVADHKALRDNLPKVISIEVTDSAGYLLGLLDNDVVLAYGNYTADFDGMTLLDCRSKWALFSAVEARSPKRMVVFRVNPETKEYSLKEIKGLQGTASELGFTTHIRYLTQKQKKRIWQTIEDSPLVSAADFNQGAGGIYGGDNYIVVAMADMRRCNLLDPYPSQIKDPSIVLAYGTGEWNEKWVTGDSLESIITYFYRRHQSDRYKLPICSEILTKDGEDYIQFDFPTRNVSYDLGTISVNDSLFNTLQAKAADGSRLLDEQQVGNLYSEALLAGEWKAVDPSASYDDAHCDIDLSLRRDGTMSLRCYGILHFGLNLYINFTAVVEGTWELMGNTIALSQDEPDVEITFVDGNGLVDEDYQSLATPENAELFYSLVQEGEPLIGQRHNKILSCDGDTLVIESEENLALVKAETKSEKKKSKKQ